MRTACGLGLGLRHNLQSEAAFSSRFRFYIKTLMLSLQHLIPIATASSLAFLRLGLSLFFRRAGIAQE